MGTKRPSWKGLLSLSAFVMQEAKLPLWLRPFEVLVTSSRTALIEMIPDTLSIHALKSRSPASMSLRSHFYAKFVQVRLALPTEMLCDTIVPVPL